MTTTTTTTTTTTATDTATATATSPRVRQAHFRCRICGASGDFAIHALREMMVGTREVFDYVQCGGCGCLQIREIPVDLARHYPADYYSQLPRTEPAPPAGIKGALVRAYCRAAALRPDAVATAVLRALLPVPADWAEFGHYLLGAQLRSADERILDVGCGASPHRLAAMRRCGFSAVEGIDPYIAAETVVYEGVAVRRLTIDAVDRGNGGFGLVMFHHSLEHVADPVAALQSAALLLRAGGTCLVRIPIIGTHFWRRYGANWVELDPPRHLYLMALETVRQLAAKTGFRVRQTVFDSEGWEIAGSLQYERDVPLRSPLADTLFSADERAAFRAEAEALNRVCDAGRACFYLEKR